MRKFFRILYFVFAIGLISLTMVRYTFSIVKSYSNYQINKEFEITEYLIYDQDYYEDFKFGIGNVADNGCGAVAMYNILKLEGKEVDFAQVIKDLEPFGTNALGLLGTNPTFIYRYLKRQGLEVSIHFNDLEENAKKGKYVILCTVDFNSGHYMTFYDRVDDKYSCLNPTLTNQEISTFIREKALNFIYVIN